MSGKYEPKHAGPEVAGPQVYEPRHARPILRFRGMPPIQGIGPVIVAVEAK